MKMGFLGVKKLKGEKWEFEKENLHVTYNGGDHDIGEKSFANASTTREMNENGIEKRVKQEIPRQTS